MQTTPGIRCLRDVVLVDFQGRDMTLTLPTKPQSSQREGSRYAMTMP